MRLTSFGNIPVSTHQLNLQMRLCANNLFKHLWALGYMPQGYDSTASIVVMRTFLSDDAAHALVERKKHSVFGSLLSHPKDTAVSVQRVDMSYECMRILSGSYEADYLRDATHTLTVNSSVRRVVIGDASFEPKKQSRLKKALRVKRGTSKIDVELKEHVYVSRTLEMTFDADGNQIQKPKYKINPDTIEARPEHILDNADNVKHSSVSREDAVSTLETKLKEPLESDIEDLQEQFDLASIVELYVPIYEARIRGPKNKVAIMRVDAASKKII